MSLFNWSHSSIKHKIGGLFLVLLAFLFFVIVYSSYKIKLIENEMSEVAYLDIPLSKVMTQVEFIELEQHLLFEQYLQQGKEAYTNLQKHQQIAFQKRNLKKLLDKSISLIQGKLESKQLILTKSDHERILQSIEQYSQTSAEYEALLQQVFSSDTITETQKNKTEQLSSELETAGNVIIRQLNEINTKDANYTEKHEEEFLFINSLLGLSALILGLLLTIYITRIILNRIKRIQGEVQTLNSSFTTKEGRIPETSSKLTTRDELVELEQEIKLMMARLSDEITSREKIEQHLLALATHDKLTGAFNRHKWKEQIDNQLNLAQRGGYQFGLILLDVDYFKKVNDQHGHVIGDSLLQWLVKTVQQRLRSTDMLFRIGGEEFVILLPMQDIESSYTVAEDIRKQIEQLSVPELPQITISAGVTGHANDDDEKSILKRADIALYQAKAQGRNQVVQASFNE